MCKRAYKMTSLMLVIVILFTILAPTCQPLMPAGAYAAAREAVPLFRNDLLTGEGLTALTPDIFTPGVSTSKISAPGMLTSEELTSKMLASKMLPSDIMALNIPETGIDSTGSTLKVGEQSVSAQPCAVEFEHAAYYALRSDDYVYIPVVLTGEMVSGADVPVNYATSDGTAVAGVDYQPASGTLSITRADLARQYNFIKIKLIKNSGTGDKIFQLTLSNPPPGVVLGDQYQAVVTIRSSYDYAAGAAWVDLYNGQSGDTGIGNWDGISPPDTFGAKEDTLYGSVKTLSVSSYINGIQEGTQGFQTKKAYRMSGLQFEWRTRHDGPVYAIISSQPGTVSANFDTLPPSTSRVGQVNEHTFNFNTYSISSKNSKSPLYVGFYAEKPSGFLELLNAKIQKKQYDFHVSIPSGSALEVAGKRYESSFTGRFTYDGSEKLKAIAPAGHSFLGWDYYLPNGDSGQLTDDDGEITINDLVTKMGNVFNLYEAQNLGIQLRPVFTRNTYIITVSSTPGGTATGGGSYLYGSEVTLKATPSSGNVFSHWSIAGEEPVDDNPWIFTAEKHLTVTANFVKGYKITAEASPPEGGTAVIEGKTMENAPITARATRNPGYRFVSWTKDTPLPLGTLVSTNADYFFNAIEDIHLVANFELIQSNISVEAYPTSGGKVSGSGVYSYGSAVALEAVPYSDYEFVNWTENGQEVSSSAAYNFPLTTETDRVFTANFSLKPGNFSMTPCSQFVGEPVTFDASLIFKDNAGITFDWQFGDGSSASGEKVSHAYTTAGKYEIILVARKGSQELVNKTREITIMEPLPPEQSDFRVEPRGVSRVAPGGKTSWTVVFTNNGVPMANKVINVNDELLGGSVDITTGAAGEAAYETSVPASQPQYGLYNVTFSHDTLAAARLLQVFSSSVTLTGQVFDSYSGRRIAGVQVSAGGQTALTDSEGKYTITGLPSGDCVLAAVLDGYQVASHELDLVSSASVCNIPLVRYIPGTLPVIGLVYSERSDSVRGVDRFFPYGEGLPLKFNVTIDWRGHAPGAVNFILPDRTVAGTLEGAGGYTASRVIDVGSEIIPGGRLYVQLVTETGVESAPVDAMIEVTPPPPFDPGLQVIEVPGIERMTIAQDMPFVGGSLISADLGRVKTEVEIDEDGTASLYLGVVCAKKEADPEDLISSLVGPEKFKEIKELYKEIQKSNSMVKTGFDYEVIVGGKYVFVYDQENKEWDFTEGWLVINGSGEYTATAYAMTPILIPVYIQAKVGGSLTVYAGVTPQELEKWQVTMTPEMWLRVAAGIGLADLISAEVFGKVHGQFTVILSRGEFDNWNVGATCGVKFVFFIFSYEESYTKRWSSDTGAQLAMILPDTGDLKPLSRDYLQRPSTWLPPEQSRVMAAADSETGGRKLEETVIQENVFPYSEPVLILTEEGPMLVWVADNPQRSDENRTEIQYSIFNGYSWSVAQAVYNDGTADFYPQAVPAAGWKGDLKNKTAAAVWTNMTKELGSSAGLNDLLAESQIAAAFYDQFKRTWTDVKSFSADGFQVTSPQVGAMDSLALVVWTRSVLPEVNESPFAVLYPQQSDIVFSQSNGRTWSEPQVAVAGAATGIDYFTA